MGFNLDEHDRTAIRLVPKGAWQHAVDAEGKARDLDKAGLVELTALLRESAGGDRLRNWPAGIRIIARRECPHPGAQLSLFEEADGWRYQLFATTPTTARGRLGQIAFLEARHTAARIIRGQRKHTIRIPETLHWANEPRDCLTAAMSLPHPT